MTHTRDAPFTRPFRLPPPACDSARLCGLYHLNPCLRMNPATPHRTWFTTLIGAAAILLGGLGSLFSLFALLLAIGKPYANSATDPLGIFLIFILPPGTLLAGIGLLLRHRWARWWMILLMAGLVALGVNGLFAPDHANPAYAPMPGPAAAAARRAVFLQSVTCIAVGSLVMLGLFSRPVRREFQAPEKSAPEFIPSAPPAMTTPSSHHEEYPETGSAFPPPAPTSSVVRPPALKQDGSILPMLVALLLVAAGAFWLAARGVESGETRLPVKHSSASRSVSRDENPALFWTSISLISALGTGCTVFAAWLVIGRLRRR